MINTTLMVYKSSVATDGEELTGNYTLLEITRSGRVQVLENDSNVKYWISAEDAYIFNDVEEVGADSADELFEADVPNTEMESVTEGTNIVEEPVTEEPIVEGTPICTTKSKPATIVHIVQRGETVTTIANKYGLTAYDIIKMSGVQKPAVGQRIYIYK